MKQDKYHLEGRSPAGHYHRWSFRATTPWAFKVVSDLAHSGWEITHLWWD